MLRDSPGWSQGGHDELAVESALTSINSTDRYRRSVSELQEDLASAELPSFDRPPVTEVVVGLQFTPLAIRAIDLAPLRQTWLDEFPNLTEQPPLDPTLEDTPWLGPRINFGLPPMMRHWWISGDQHRLLQVQQDRFLFNWRRIGGLEDPYPRYPAIRAAFVEHFAQFQEFAVQHSPMGLSLTQCEVTYINDLALDGPLPSLSSDVLRCWADVPGHHLGNPAEFQFAQVYPIPRSAGAAKLYVSVNPFNRPDGTPSTSMTLTVRGRPTSGDPATALGFLNDAREHIVRSFTELTAEPMHRRWGKQ